MRAIAIKTKLIFAFATIGFLMLASSGFFTGRSGRLIMQLQILKP